MEAAPAAGKHESNGGELSGDDNMCRDIIGWFEDVAASAAAVQTETLRRILERNSGAEYLRKWLGEIRLQEMEGRALESVYSSRVPLVSHGDLEPYIQRIAEGETSPLLTQERITTLSLSSGTTEGRQKFVPFTHHSSHTTLQICSLAAAYRSKVYPIRGGGKVLEFIYSSKQFKTKGGLTAGTATTHFFASQEFRTKQKEAKSFTCSPIEVISSGDYRQSLYCHLLLGFFHSHEIESLSSTFAFSIVQALGALEELWKELCHDLKQGTLSPRINIPEIRRAMARSVSADPNLAVQIESRCRNLEKADWLGLVPALWPNAKYLHSIMTGSMQPYVKKLRHYAGDLPLVSADYGSTESWIGVNIDQGSAPEDVAFAVVPTISYFEFIPLYRARRECGDLGTGDDFAEGEAVPLSQVKIGQEYEIVLTTFTGLYRYRLGDVVEVADFHKGTPKLSFVCRRRLILTINIDKNTEKDLQLVVEKGSQLLTTARAELVDFTSHADVESQPGHYVIYWEIKGDVAEAVLHDCCREMDASFVDPGYVVSRRTNSIGPLELCIVEKGTFRKILDYFVGNGGGMNQFKTPRCTSNEALLEILNGRIAKRFYSAAYMGERIE